MPTVVQPGFFLIEQSVDWPETTQPDRSAIEPHTFNAPTNLNI
jgi:hypothetical protein